MMDGPYRGLVAASVIAGLVEVARRCGLPPRAAAPFAVALGLAISLAGAAAAELPGGSATVDAVLQGLAHGLSGAGLRWTLRLGRDDAESAEPRRS